MLEACWEQSKGENEFVNKLHTCGELLSKWASEKVGNTKKKIQQITQEIDNLQERDGETEAEEELKWKEKQLKKLLLQEEMLWHQRSRKQWLEAGDKNTSFFHHCTRARRSRNQINRLVSDNGTIYTMPDDICNCISEFYANLFTSSCPTWNDIEQVLQYVTPRMDDNMNKHLDQKFTEEEIKRAVFDLSPSKAPGPDGFTASFYQLMWSKMKEDVCEATLGILNNGRSLNKWNETEITLIPKVKNPDKVKDFRPISLYIQE